MYTTLKMHGLAKSTKVLHCCSSICHLRLCLRWQLGSILRSPYNPYLQAIYMDNLLVWLSGTSMAWSLTLELCWASERGDSPLCFPSHPFIYVFGTYPDVQASNTRNILAKLPQFPVSHLWPLSSSLPFSTYISFHSLYSKMHLYSGLKKWAASVWVTKHHIDEKKGTHDKGHAIFTLV